jgi:YgiT-type zinc finger domain-containing protein
VTFPEPSEYGTCPCTGVYDRRRVDVRMTVGERVVVLTDVPQGVCPMCGSRVYKAGVLQVLEALMRGQPVMPGLGDRSVL